MCFFFGFDIVFGVVIIEGVIFGRFGVDYVGKCVWVEFCVYWCLKDDLVFFVVCVDDSEVILG